MEDHLLLLDSPSCSFANLDAECKISVKHFGHLDIISSLNPCISPPAVDVAIEMNKYGQWEFNFLAGNSVESRQIGPDFWPLWLRVFFDQSTPSDLNKNGIKSLFLKACIQVAKTGEQLCFLNETLIPSACSTGKKGSVLSALPLAVLVTILLLLFLTLLIAGIIWWRRIRITGQKYAKHVDLNQSAASAQPDGTPHAAPIIRETPPPLPNSKQYVMYEIAEEDEFCPSCKRDRSLIIIRPPC